MIAPNDTNKVEVAMCATIRETLVQKLQLKYCAVYSDRRKGHNGVVRRVKMYGVKGGPYAYATLESQIKDELDKLNPGLKLFGYRAEWAPMRSVCNWRSVAFNLISLRTEKIAHERKLGQHLAKVEAYKAADRVLDSAYRDRQKTVDQISILQSTLRACQAGLAELDATIEQARKARQLAWNKI